MVTRGHAGRHMPLLLVSALCPTTGQHAERGYKDHVEFYRRSSQELESLNRGYFQAYHTIAKSARAQEMSEVSILRHRGGVGPTA